MGLVKIKELGNADKLGLWHIRETVAGLLKMKELSAGEHSILSSFSYEHRKKEWLVSKILTEQLSGDSDIRIGYDEHSKPFLKDSKFKISISHSHELLAVLIAEQETGIDIELIKPNVVNIRHKFMSEKEREGSGGTDHPEKLTLYWCVKESLYKYYGKKQLTFKEHLIVEPFELTESGSVAASIEHATMKKKFRLNYEKVYASGQAYMLAYIVKEV